MVLVLVLVLIVRLQRAKYALSLILSSTSRMAQLEKETRETEVALTDAYRASQVNCA